MSNKKKLSISKMDNYRDDDMIRSAGFTIYSRPKDGSPVWQRAGILYPQYRALEIAIHKHSNNQSGN